MGKNAVEETVQLLNKALRYADERFDDGGGCRQLLVFTYIKMGEYEKAKEAAMSAPLLPGCREMLLPQTLQGQEAIEEYQKNILHFTTGLYHNISDLRTRGDYSDKQKLEISLMAEQMLLLIGGDNSGFVELFSNTLQILKIHVKTNNKESTIKYLEKALQYAENLPQQRCKGSRQRTLERLHYP